MRNSIIAGLGGEIGHHDLYAEPIGVMAATRVDSTLAYWAAAAFALVLSMVPEVWRRWSPLIPLRASLGGLRERSPFGLIAILGARIWVENRVNFANPVNLVTAAVAIIVGTADYVATAGSMVFNGIALGAVAALANLPRARLRGPTPWGRDTAPLSSVATEPEDAKP